MATIGASVSIETKAEFDSVAHARGVTPSRLAAYVIENFLKREAGNTPSLLPAPAPMRTPLVSVASAPGGAKTRQVFVRLEPYYHNELIRLANERVWFPATYLANLFTAHVDRRPVLCNAEINAIREVARQLADMGRNINQIAKMLNTSLDYAYLVASVDFEVVKMLIELETNAVKDLMKANVRGWGVSDADA